MQDNSHLRFCNIYMILLCFAILFMSVGYAAINSISLNVNGEMIALAQEGVFITDVNIDSENSVDANLVNTKVNSAYQTMLNSNVYLSETNPDSTVVIDITIHNSTDKDYVFREVTYEVGDKTYSNENIVYDLSSIEPGDRLLKDKDITFQIIFSYKDNKVADSNILLSYLNFNFDVYVPDVLYEMMAYASTGLDTSIRFSSISSDTNGLGVYTMESTQNDNYPIHYYRGAVTNNNVLFANYCWKIVRTTETGGVKLIYNGEPNEDGQCLSDRSNHIGYEYKTTETLSSSYYYGTSYTYDASTSEFSLAGELTQATWNETTGPTLIEKFTCKSATADGTCSTLYQVASYNSASSAYVFPLNTTTNYTQIGVSYFNSKFGTPAGAGYMYDTIYGYSSLSSSANVLRRDSTSASTNYYYGNDIIINTDGTYTLQNKTLNEDGETYTITEAERKIWSDNYSTLAGYYTCRRTSTTCSTVYYIAGTTSSYQFNVALSGGAELDSQKIIVSVIKTNNEDGTYTLTEPIEVLKKDWFTNHSKYINYYICKDLTSTTCSPMAQITATTSDRVTYLESIGYVYGNDVSWDGTNYTLVDTIKSNDGWSADYKNLALKHHYTCLDTDGVCTSVYYIHYFGSSSNMYYITLKEGKDIEVAKEEMFTNDENSTSSDIKLQIDSWYAANMTEYTEKLEDTIFCNDRTMYSGSLVGKDENAGTEYSYFGASGRVYKTYEPSVNCPNVARDGFTVNQENGGNGLLKYPVGLLTADEIMLAGGRASFSNTSYYLYTKQNYWSLSPCYFDISAAHVFNVAGGSLTNYHGYGPSRGVRPSVSLAPGTKSKGGDGSEETPYIVE